MTIKSIGVHGEDAVEALRTAKIGFVPRMGEIWCEEEDIEKAKGILGELRKKRKVDEMKYSVCGVVLRSEIQIVTENVGQAKEPSNRKDRITVNVFSRPKGGPDPVEYSKHLKTTKVNGKELVIDSPCFSPSYKGIIFADEDGFALFEVVPFNVFILWNVDRNPVASKQILEDLLTFALVSANHSDERSVKLYEEIAESQKPKRDQIEIENFEKIHSEVIMQRLEEYKNDMTRQRAVIDDAHKSIFAATQQLHENEIGVTVLEEAKKNLREKAREEYAKIRKLEKGGVVKEIEIMPETIRFKTGMIRWRRTKEDADIELGEFLVTVTYSKNFSVKIHNLTKTLDYDGYRWHHPHAQEGNVCVGNLKNALPEFAARREFEAIIMCMLKWLGNIDIEDAWGRKVGLWEQDFEKKKKEKK